VANVHKKYLVKTAIAAQSEFVKTAPEIHLINHVLQNKKAA
jgi:hypothetical protein